MAARNAAQIARNTTAYPTTRPGGGPTYTAPAAYTAPIPTLTAPQYQEQPAAPVAQALTETPSPFETDPGYLAALAAQQAGVQQIDAALRAAQERAIVQFGDPSLAAAAGIDLSPLTAAMAQQNTAAGNSTLAQLQRQRDQTQMSIVNGLAAHGLINSGDLGYKTAQNTQNYGTALYGAQQSLLDSLAQQASSSAQQKQKLSGDTNTALTQAYDTYIANPQYWGALDGGHVAAANTAASAPQPATPVSPPAAHPITSRLAQKPVGTSTRSFQVGRNSY